MAVPEVREHQLAVADGVRDEELQRDAALAAGTQARRLVLSEVRQPQLRPPLVMQQHALHKHDREAWRLGVREVRQPQLRQQEVVQQEVLPGVEALLEVRRSGVGSGDVLTVLAAGMRRVPEFSGLVADADESTAPRKTCLRARAHFERKMEGGEGEERRGTRARRQGDESEMTGGMLECISFYA